MHRKDQKVCSDATLLSAWCLDRCADLDLMDEKATMINLRYHRLSLHASVSDAFSFDLLLNEFVIDVEVLFGLVHDARRGREEFSSKIPQIPGISPGIVPTH